MNLPKIRASFAAIAAAIAYLIVPSASAAILATNNFETACDGFVADIDGEDASAITAYNADQPSTTAPYPFTGSGDAGFGSKYLKVDTGDATIFREFDAQTSSAYLDAYMQFEPTSGEISYTNVAKIVVYLDAATSNLCVISGTNEGTRTPVTNRLDTAAAGSATVVPGTWGRLTVNAIKTSSGIFSFNVLLNGKKLSAGSTDTFYSRTDSNAVSRVGFKGTGALDDLVARTSDPFGTAAKIGEETYGSLAQAGAEAVAGDTIILQNASNEDITLREVGVVFNTNGKSYSGTISGASGVGISEENGVYTSIANTASTWTGSGGDGLWEDAQNWSTKSVPTSATTVTFNEDAIVNIPYNSAVANGIVISEGYTLTLRRSGETPGTAWSTITVGAGGVSGNGTVKLVASGIKKSVSSFTINANLEFENDGTHDSFLEETVSGTFTINGTVTGVGYLQVKTSTTFNGNVTLSSNAKLHCAWTPVFNASLIAGENSTISFQDGNYRNQTFNGTVSLAAGSMLTPTSGTCPTFGNSSLLTGSGTFVLNGFDASDKIKSFIQNSDSWTGTCELKSVNISNLDFADYGNENSYVGANDLSGTFKGSGVCRIADGIKGLKLAGNGLTVGDWSTSHTYVIAADISGSGPINLNIQSNAGNPLNAPASIDKVVFTGGTSDFTGQVKFKNTSYRPCYIFANESDLESLPTPTDYGQIIVMAGKTVNVGSVWTAPGGFLINGEADTKSSSAYLSGTVLGNGTVKVAYTHSSDALRVPNFGNASANTFEITGMTGGWISNADATGMPNINATVKLSGNVTINNGYGADDETSNAMIFKRLTGSGNLSFSFSTSKSYANYTVSTINGAVNADNPYTGTITANNKARVVISVVDVDEVPLDGRRLVGIANSNRDRFVNASGTAINNNGLIDVTVGGAADTAKLYADTDGLYVAIAQVGDTYYKSLRAAADAARAADTTFTRVYAGAGETYPGWTYSDGVFTFDNKFAYNATKDVAYATLQEAITASSDGDTIALLGGNSEAAVDTTGKDFIFDENGYAFSGTLTGNGTITFAAAPSSTTWNSSLFVAEGWTGTVVLDYDPSGTPFNPNPYGTSSSYVELATGRSVSGYLNDSITTKLRVNGSVTLNNGSSSTQRGFRTVSGNGTFTFQAHDGGYGETCNYAIDNLVDWNGTITVGSSKASITNIVSGSGSVVFNVAPTPTPTIDSGYTGSVVFKVKPTPAPTIDSGYTGEIELAFNWQNVDLSAYSGDNATLVLNYNMNNGYFAENNGGATGIKGKTVINGTVSIINGWPRGSGNYWSDDRCVKFNTLEVAGSISLIYPTGTGWKNYWGYISAATLDGDSTGSITVGNNFLLKVNAVDFAAAPSGTGRLVSLALTGENDSEGYTHKGKLYGPNGVAGEAIPVTIGGVATGQKLVYATINDASGLYLAVAQYGSNYYATFQDALNARKSAGVPGDITVLDATAPLPAGYSITDGKLVRTLKPMVILF